ncbi:MAG: 4-hydroxy-tetrahydrodipicolinate synthase [Bacteroidota bacterium]
MTATRWQGTGVALVTPFDHQLRVDWAGLARLLAHVAAADVDYLVVQGTTGEAATTTPQEKREILHFIQEHNTRQLPIVYGLGGNATQLMAEEMAHTDWTGVAAILLGSPYYNKPSQEGLYRHYQALATAAPIPILLYNVPSRTGVNLAAATTLRLFEETRIVGIKEASDNFVQCIQIAQGAPSDCALIAGDDILALPMLSIGAVGVISALANAFPTQVAQMTRAALAQDYGQARAHQRLLLAWQELMHTGGNPGVVKYMLSALKICAPYVRAPLSDIPRPIARKIDLLAASYLRSPAKPIPLPYSGHTQA